MFDKNEFRKYATKHLNISSTLLDDYTKHNVNAFSQIQATTPYVIEERKMNATVLDVFSRLLMDRIIFLGTPVTDQIANIIQGQLLFLESVDARRDIQLFVNSPGGSVIEYWQW